VRYISVRRKKKKRGIGGYEVDGCFPSPLFSVIEAIEGKKGGKVNSASRETRCLVRKENWREENELPRIA